MAGQTNDRLKFDRRAPRTVDTYTSDYVDKQGNRWWIELVGDPEVIAPLADSAAIMLEAEPVSPEKAAAYADQLAKAAGQSSGNGSSERETTQAPALEASVELISLADPSAAAYILHFVIDPTISPSSSPQRWNFRSLGRDASPDLFYTVNNGDVSVRLDGSGGTFVVPGPGFDNRLNLPNGIGGIWSVTVSWKSGAPTYTLGGDPLVRQR